jgi:aminoglycoside/choline kinase family phosphotransferase
VGIAEQILTLSGVALGALFSYLITSMNERTRYRRAIAERWEGRKFDAYSSYLGDVKEMVAVANRITQSVGLHNRTTAPLDKEQGLVLLAEVGTRRTVSSDRAALLANMETAQALRHLDSTAWLLESFARDTVRNVSPEGWKEAMTSYRNALNIFLQSARNELGLPGEVLGHQDVSDLSKPPDGSLEQLPT